jgi:hypothetical protein
MTSSIILAPTTALAIASPVKPEAGLLFLPGKHDNRVVHEERRRIEIPDHYSHWRCGWQLSPSRY